MSFYSAADERCDATCWLLMTWRQRRKMEKQFFDILSMRFLIETFKKLKIVRIYGCRLEHFMFSWDKYPLFEWNLINKNQETAEKSDILTSKLFKVSTSTTARQKNIWVNWIAKRNNSLFCHCCWGKYLKAERCNLME